MSAICGYTGGDGRAALDAMLAASSCHGGTADKRVVEGAGIGRYGTAGAAGSISHNATQISVISGTIVAPEMASSANLARLLADPAALPSLDGRFSAVAWDGATKRLTLLRDPFGARPLFYVWHGGTFYFASELKQLLAIPGLPVAPDLAAIHKYLTFSFVPGEDMPISGIKRLPPGVIATVENSKLTQRPYFTLTEAIDPAFEDQHAAVRLIASRCRKAVAARAASLSKGAEAGLFLSGGLDSSGVGVWLKRLGVKVRAFTLDFGAESFETEQAKRVANQLDFPLTLVKVDGADVAAVIPSLAWSLDLPFGDPVTGPQYLMAKAARDAGLSVVFNGEGGDQLFGGWTSKPMIAAELYSGLYAEDTREQQYLKSYHRFYGAEDELYTDAFKHGIGPPGVRRALLSPYLGDGTTDTFLNRVRLADINLKGSQNILPRMTQTALGWGIDVVAPLFDRALAEASFKLPPQMKLNGACEKYVLKLVLQNALPADIVWQRKLGMGVPVTTWAFDGLKPALDDLLSEDSVKARGLFDPATIARLRSGENEPGEIRRRRLGERLWTLAMLEAWMRVFIDGRGKAPGGIA